ISGTYRFFVKVDAGNAVNEFVLEGNNLTMSATGTVVTLAPYADLQVTLVTVPELVVGNPASIDVGWTVQNFGTGAGRTSSWIDRVLLSRNASVGDADDQVMGEFANSGALNTFEGNNLTEPNNLLAISPVPFADLVISDVTVPSTGASGRPLAVSWTVHN